MQQLVEEDAALRRQLTELEPAAPAVLTRSPYGSRRRLDAGAVTRRSNARSERAPKAAWIRA